MTETGEAHSAKFAEMRGRADALDVQTWGIWMTDPNSSRSYVEAVHQSAADVLLLVDVAEAAHAYRELTKPTLSTPAVLWSGPTALRMAADRQERIEAASARLAEALTKLSSVLVGGVVDGG